MAGDLREQLRAATTFGEAGRHGLVGACSLPGQQPRLRDLAQQRVVEAHAVTAPRRRIGRQHAGVDRLPQGGLQSVRSDSPQGLERVCIAMPSGHRREARQAARVRREGAQPHAERVPQARRKRHVGIHEHALVRVRIDRGEELLEEQRIALGPGVEAIHGGGREGPAQGRRCLLRDLAPGEAGELHAPDVRASLQLRGECRERMARGQVVGAAGEQQEQPRRAHVAREEEEQVPGGAVRPLEVLHGQDAGRPRSQSLGDAAQLLEQHGPRQARVLLAAGDRSQLRQQSSDLRAGATQDRQQLLRWERGDHPPQQLDEGQVGYVTGPQRQAGTDPQRDPRT